MLSLPNNDIYMALIRGLIDNGWKGTWNIKGDQIIIDTDFGESLETRFKKKPLSYYEALRLSMCMGMHLAALIPLNKSVLFFSTKTIYIIDEDWYILLDPAIVSIISDNTVMQTTPIDLNEELAPEVKNNSSLPFKTNISCAYYSLASLVVKMLDINNDLDRLAGSKLYYFLERCFVNDPSKRFFLFI